jgi:PAS domain S-box-containing protein
MKLSILSTLRSRLIVLIMLVLIAAFALILHTALEQRRLAVMNTAENMRQIARIATSEHEQLIEGARQLLVGLSHLPQVIRREADACNSLFRELALQFPTYASLVAAKPNGDVFCSSVPVPRAVNIADLPTFQRTLKTRNFTVSDYSIGRISNRPVITFSYPSVDLAGDIKAYVAIGMDLTWFNKIAADATLPSSVTLSIIDRHGTVLARYPASRPEQIGHSIRDTSLMESLLARTEGMVEATGLDGITRLHVNTSLHGTEQPSLFVSVGIPSAVVFAQANKILTYNLVGLGAIGWLALMGAWFGSELFYLRRVNTLLRVTRQLAAGDLSARTGLPDGADEINELVRNIDEMAASLERLIAERKQTEQALRESEQLYRAVVENVADGIVINVGDKRAFVNEAFMKIHGLSDASQIVGSPMDRFIVPEDRHLVIQRTLARQRGEPVPRVYEYRILRADGEVRTVQTSVSPIVYLGQAAALAALRDRTEEKLAEQLLRDSENKFRSVVETATDAVVSADSGGRIVFLNKSAEQTFGYDAQEVMGKPVALLTPARFQSAYHQGFIRDVSSGQGSLLGTTVEMTGLNRDGTEFPLEISLATWYSNGEPFFTAFIRDITKRKRAEETITRLNKDLKKYTEQLQAMNQELEAFSYSVSHDLRTPLRAIDGFSRILIEDFSSSLPAEAQRLLNIVRSNTHQMSTLIDDLLAFARLSRQSFDCTTIDMAALAQAALEELKKGETQQLVPVTIHPLVPAQGNVSLIQQVMINLISNAVKFSRFRAEPRVEIGCFPDRNENTYFVKDNGVGFDMAYADKLFGVFQRLHSVQEFEGTGVGLAIVKRIINRHNGRVWAHAKANEGATFYFTLPPASEAA